MLQVFSLGRVLPVNKLSLLRFLLVVLSLQPFRLACLFICGSDASFVIRQCALFWGLGLAQFLPSLIDAIMISQKVASFDRHKGSSLVKRISIFGVFGCFKK